MAPIQAKEEPAALAEFLRQARARWPNARWSDDILARHFQALRERGLDPLHGELLLALACLHQDPAAWAELDRHCIQSVVPVLKTMGLGPADRDEVLQRLRTKLQGLESGAPRLELFKGLGSLRGFVRTLAVRLALDLRAEPRLDEEILRLFAQEVRDPEIVFLKEHYAARFAEAVRAALARLTPRQRLFLSHQLSDHLSVSALASLYGIHRATAARRCASARAALARYTRRELRNMLAVGPKTLASITRLLDSRLEEIVAKNVNLSDEP